MFFEVINGVFCVSRPACWAEVIDPEVFADGESDFQIFMFDDSGLISGVEISFFIEDIVCWEESFIVPFYDFALFAERDAV